jgi:uncharacterized protein (TIGR02996 family)
MPTEEELLAAIDAGPFDDAPRLAHADWLENNGDTDRAEYIRLQLSLTALPSTGPRDPRANRASALLRANLKRWLGERPQKDVLWKFVRGYPEEVAFPTLTAFRQAGRKALSFPVRWVSFTRLQGTGGLADCPAMPLVRRLALHCFAIDEAGLLALLSSPRLQLEGLCVSRTQLSGRALQFLAQWPGLAALRELSLQGTLRQHPNAEAVEAFASSPGLAGLRRLEISQCGLGGNTVRAIWSSPHLRALEVLSLASNCLGPTGLAGLGDGGRMPALRELNLSQCQLGDAGTQALMGAIRWTGLRRLELERNMIGDEGARAIASAAHLARLERLNLSGNTISNAGAEAIAESEHLSALRLLRLSENLIGDAGMAALGRSRSLARAVDFTASRNPALPELIAAVEARFQQSLPPLEDAPAAPAPAPAPVSAASVGASDEDGLVRAILADPSDGLARRVYTDWLEEHGAARQAELMRLPPGEKKRRGTLLKALRQAVDAAFPYEGLTIEEDNGLLSVTVSMRTFLKKSFQEAAPKWLDEQHITWVRLVGQSKNWGKVGATPLAAKLRGLSLFGSQPRDVGVSALARVGLPGACSLNLFGTEMHDAGLVALGATTAMPRLVHLKLGGNWVTATGLRALADGPLAGQIQYLDLSNVHIQDLGVGVIVQSARLAGGLVALSLSSCWLSDQAAAALASSPHLGRLRSLDIGRNGITGGGTLALADSPLLRRLRRLSLGMLRRCDDESRATLLRAAASVPGLVVVVSRYWGERVVAEAREALGERLIVED